MDELDRKDRDLFNEIVDDRVAQRVFSRKRKFDDAVTTWWALHLPEFRTPGLSADKSRTTSLLRPLFMPDEFDEKSANINRLFYLRFPDYSPTYVLRDLSSEDAITELNNVRVPRLLSAALTT